MINVDPLAAYGAGLATLSIVWQIFTWWNKGGKLRGHATTGMILVGGPAKDNNTYIALDVSNVGDAPTTITNVVLMGYRHRMSALLRRTEAHGAVVNNRLSQPIPFNLPAGGQFAQRLIQSPEFEQWSRTTSFTSACAIRCGVDRTWLE